MARLPPKKVRIARARKGAEKRNAIYHAQLAAQGITPEEMRRRNNVERVRRFRANKKREGKAA